MGGYEGTVAWLEDNIINLSILKVGVVLFKVFFEKGQGNFRRIVLVELILVDILAEYRGGYLQPKVSVLFFLASVILVVHI